MKILTNSVLNSLFYALSGADKHYIPILFVKTLRQKSARGRILGKNKILPV